MSTTMCTRWVLCFTLLGLLLLDHVRSDDQFLCCMKGIKSIRNIELCPAPCCLGYKRVVFFAKKLSRIEYCEKMTSDETKSLKTEIEIASPV